MPFLKKANATFDQIVVDFSPGTKPIQPKPQPKQGRPAPKSERAK